MKMNIGSDPAYPIGNLQMPHLQMHTHYTQTFHHLHLIMTDAGSNGREFRTFSIVPTYPNYTDHIILVLIIMSNQTLTLLYLHTCMISNHENTVLVDV